MGTFPQFHIFSPSHFSYVSPFPVVFPQFSRLWVSSPVHEALGIFEDLGDSRSEARATHLLAEAGLGGLGLHPEVG